MKRFYILAALTALMTSGDTVLAQQQGKNGKSNRTQEVRPGRGENQGGGQKSDGGGLFRLLDVDRNGRLSANEIDGAIGVLMKLDANDDGILDAKELAVRGEEGKGRGGGKGGQGGNGNRPFGN